MASVDNFSIKDPSVYFNPDVSINKFLPTTKACDRIGAIWAKLREANLGRLQNSSPAIQALDLCQNPVKKHLPSTAYLDLATPKSFAGVLETEQEMISLLERLGVARTDTQAHEAIAPMLEEIFKGDVQITPSEDNSGVFFLSRNGKRFAVFKVGEKRARMELFARKIAHQLGLEKHAISGVACSIERPKFPEDEIQVELFNGNVKVFKSPGAKNYNKAVISENENTKKPYTITGILEPYIAPDQEITPEEFASLVVYSLFIGLRDGKLDGIVGPCIVDLEDCMPQRFIPNITPDRTVAATHLPLLEHSHSEQLISVETLEKLAEVINKRAMPIVNQLKEERVEFADLTGESFDPYDDGSSIGYDDGGCPVRVETSEQIMDEHPAIVVESLQNPLFTTEQLNACTERVRALQTTLMQIESDKLISATHLVCAVDPFYKAHHTALQRTGYDRIHPAHVIGRFTPKVTGTPLDPSESEALRACCRTLFADNLDNDRKESVV